MSAIKVIAKDLFTVVLIVIAGIYAWIGSIKERAEGQTNDR